jgi:ADP-ribose pyrophosphatase YjhB (NUDIX family)
MITGKRFYEKLPAKRMGAGVVFTDSSGKILLVKPSYKDHWNLPGGVIELNESPREAGEREVFEEVGLKVKLDRLLVVNYNTKNGEIPENIQWVFWGGMLEQKKISEIKVDGEEIVDFGFFEVEEAIKLVKAEAKIKNLTKLLEMNGAVYFENWQQV